MFHTNQTHNYHFQNVVNLIESLESRCIKFVHFSSENELRSRVFSEKMGLEAGWNCHISLLEEEEDVGDGGDSGLDFGGGKDMCFNGDGRDFIGRKIDGDRSALLGGEVDDFVRWGGYRRGSNLHRSVPFLHPRTSLTTPHPPTSTPSNDGSTPIQAIDPKLLSS